MFVDGVKITVVIYGTEIITAQFFKFLGVVLDSTCSSTWHSSARCLSFDRPAHLSLAGLSHIPSDPHVAHVPLVMSLCASSSLWFGVVLSVVGTELLLSSLGRWSEAGQCVSLHAYSLPANVNGLRCRPAERRNSQTYWSCPVRKHIHEISQHL